MPAVDPGSLPSDCRSRAGAPPAAAGAAGSYDGKCSARRPAIDPASSDPPLIAGAPASVREIEESVAPTLGESAVGREASELVRALVKASRSVILYDAANQTVHDFLEELRGRLVGFLAAHGALALTILPYDIALGSEVVYRERDRERSLALRLYRDGVRRITVEPEVPWEEVSQLVGILAVRFKGVRLQEEDIVTMLWKASFAHIKVEAVERLVAAEDGGETSADVGTTRVSLRAAALLRAPFVFAEPWPQLPDRRQVSFAPLSPEALARIAAEDVEGALPPDCVALVGEVTAALADPAAELVPADVAPLLREVRDFLLAAGRPDLVVEPARIVAATLPGAEEARDELLLACLDGNALRALLVANRGVASLAGLLTAAHLDILVDLLVEDGGGAARERLLDLVAAAAGGRAEALRRRLAAAHGTPAAHLLRVLQRISPDEATQAAVGALAGSDLVLQREALQVLQGAAYGPKVGRALVGALNAADEEVRLGALQLLVKQRERRAFLPLAERVRGLAGAAISGREATACGIALAQLDDAEALRLFRAWVKPAAGLLGRVIPHAPLLLAVAAGGLSRLAGDEVDELLGVLARNGPHDVRATCQAELDRRREGGP